MKKFNFSVLFVALFAMLSFTSCLDSVEDDGTRTNNYYVKVISSMGTVYLEDAAGNKFVPSVGTPVTDPESDMALMNLTYNVSDVEANAASGKPIPVVVNAIIDYIRPITPVMDIENAEWNAPIKALEDLSTNIRLGFWDKNTLIVPVFFYFDDAVGDDKDKIKAEFAKHQFEFYRVTEGDDAVEGNLVLGVRHRVQDSEVKPMRTKTASRYYYINLLSAINSYKAQYGGVLPKQVVLQIEQNLINDEYANDFVTTKSYMLTYPFTEQ